MTFQDSKKVYTAQKHLKYYEMIVTMLFSFPFVGFQFSEVLQSCISAYRNHSSLNIKLPCLYMFDRCTQLILYIAMFAIPYILSPILFLDLIFH